MDIEIRSWLRPYFETSGGEPSLFYVVYGSFTGRLQLDAARYRSSGLPEGLNLGIYSLSEHGETVEAFRTGYFGQWLWEMDPALAAAVTAAPACAILRGELADSPTLDYLRDVVGLVTCLLDAGGLAVLDPQAFQWWSSAKWREAIFEGAGSNLKQHVTILVSEDETAPGRNWWHTRGLRKFGRPDLSVRRVPPGAQPGVEKLLNRFIDLAALGYVIPEGQSIRLEGVPAGMTCHHGGDLDDPEYNNVHVEITWPG